MSKETQFQKRFVWYCLDFNNRKYIFKNFLAGLDYFFNIHCIMLIFRTEIQERSKNAKDLSCIKTEMSVMAIIKT